MPLVKRKQVQYLPLPPGVTDGSIPPDQEVWQIKQTGEIFIDYESFNDRIQYYMQPIFTCELTGKSGLTYFGAVESEQNESYKIQTTFPEKLKPKVLRACHFQVEGRLERLVDLCYERFNNRFFLGEHVIITSPANGIKLTYFGIVNRVTPPKALRDLLRPGNEALLEEIAERNGKFVPAEVQGDESDDEGKKYTAEELDLVSHIVGGRQLEISTEEANTLDDPAAYVYSVQLLQGEKFDGSIINVDYTQLERDKTRWNKALLKKFLKESITRDPAVGSCWLAKPDIAKKYAFPTTCPPHLFEKGRELRVDLLERRRKPREEDPNAPPKPPRVKRPKLDSGAASRRNSSNSVLSPLPSDDLQASSAFRNGYAGSPLAGPSGTTGPNAVAGDGSTSIAQAAAIPTVPNRPMPKPKYPIEDLDLDPTTILDGRVRRAKHLALPPLPKKPLPSKDLPVPEEHMDRTLMCWNVLNIFGQALQISPFTLDDFVNALNHDTLDPRCVLLGEIHSVLTCNIAAETHSLPAGQKASVDSLPVLAATIENTDGMSIAKREMWVNAALDYSRGWDRKARPRAADGRRGWERHLLGILTQKGGLEAVPSLPTIFKHLFTDDDYVSEPEEELEEIEAAEEKKPSAQSNGNGADDMDVDGDGVDGAVKAERKSSPTSSFKRESSASSEPQNDQLKKEDDDADDREDKDELAEDAEEQMEIDSSDADVAAPTTTSTVTKKFKKPRFAGSDHPDPEARYLTLSLEHKLDILSFLCQINLQSKVVKAYIDDCETRLTEERKEKAELNKEKKELLAEKTALLKPKIVPGAEGESKPASEGLTVANGEASTGAPSSAAVTPLLAAPGRMDDISSSVAPSEAGDSAMPDEPPSRQPSSSPLPELDDSSSTHSMTAKDNGDVEAADQTELKSDMPDDTSEAADVEEEQDGMDQDAAEEEAIAADGGDEQDELDVGSDVDELQSSADEMEEPPKPDTPVVEKAPRGGKGKKGKGGAGKKRAKSVDRQVEIEQELEANARNDDQLERNWRRFREVARIRPLGKDRFYQRIWWFDGIGHQTLIAPNGRIAYGTGRLFVQGPSQEDYEMMCAEYGGEETIAARMKYEQGQEPLLKVDEWGLYESSEEIDQLCNWLNNKGIREKDLKARLEKWKHYIVEGSKARQEDLLHGFEATAPAAHARRTRGARGSKEYHETPAKHYLSYENSLAQK